MASFDQVVNPEQSPEQTPGGMLRQARAAAGISAREMADRLNWLPRYVSAIEENRFDEMRGTAFVRGYLRAYGKMLGVDQQELLSAYTAMALPEQTLAISASTDRQEPFTRRPIVGISASIAGAILVVMVFLWWQGDSGQGDGATAESPAVQNKATQLPAPRRPEALSPVEQAPVKQAPIEEAIVPVDDAATEITVEQVAVVVAQPPAPSSQVSFTAALLQFRFSGDCWLEVRDGTDTRIYADLRRSGDELGLDGQPPFAILVGDSRYVQLHYDGQEFEIQSRPGRIVARFSVGEQ